MDVGAYLMSVSAVKYLLQYFNGEKIPESARRVGKVVQLNIYPVKSMKGIQVEEVLCKKTGVTHNGFHDRGWMVATESYTGSYNAVSGRNSPKIAKIKTSVHGDEIHLEADGLSVFKLPLNPDFTNLKAVWIRSIGQYMQGFDFGDDAADWITSFFQNSGKYRFICCPMSGKNRYGCTKSKVLRLWTDPIDHTQVNFHDGYNCSLASEASLADLSNTAQKSIPMRNFRVNIIIDGLESYDEDSWEEIYIGDTKFTNTFLGIRCSFITVDQDKGKRDSDGEPIRTLRQYRLSDKTSRIFPYFGINMFFNRGGTIRVGDEVYATQKADFVF